VIFQQDDEWRAPEPDTRQEILRLSIRRSKDTRSAGLQVSPVGHHRQASDRRSRTFALVIRAPALAISDHW
jgi:hypothetical protein